VSAPALTRIRHAFLAHGVARGARIAEQLLLIPLLLAAWGVEQYGAWIALNSLAALASVAALGIGHTASADIVLRHGEDDEAEAARSFTTAMALMVATTALGFAGLWLVGALTDVADAAASGIIPPDDAHRILLLVGLATLLSFWIEPTVGVLSAVRGAALPNLITGAVKAAEIACVAMALAVGAGPAGIAGVILAAVVLNILVNLALVRRHAPWIWAGRRGLSLAPVRRAWRSALSLHLAFLALNVASIHGPRLIIAHELGAAAVTVFTVIVTYTRTARNLSGMIVQSAQAEIGRAYGRLDLGLTRHLIQSAMGSSLGLCLLLIAGALAASPVFIPLWTHGSVGVDPPLLAALGAVAVAGSLFDTLLNTTLAINRLAPVALSYCAGLLAALGTGWVLLADFGTTAMATALLLPEIAGAAAGLIVLGRVLGGPLALRDLSFVPWRFLAARRGP
jgi:O-antigen/teichoic acid export membrane protein